MVRIFQHIPPLSLIMMTPSLLPLVHQFSLTYDHPFPPSLTNILPCSSSNNTPPLPSPSTFLPLAQRTPVEVSVCEPLHTACLQRRSWKSWPLPRTVQCSSPSCRKSPPRDGSTESFGTPDGGDIVGEVSFIAQTLLLFSWSYGVNWLPGLVISDLMILQKGGSKNSVRLCTINTCPKYWNWSTKVQLALCLIFHHKHTRLILKLEFDLWGQKAAFSLSTPCADF